MGTTEAHSINLAQNFHDSTGPVADFRFSSPLIVGRANFVYGNQAQKKLEYHHNRQTVHSPLFFCAIVDVDR